MEYFKLTGYQCTDAGFQQLPIKCQTITPQDKSGKTDVMRLGLTHYPERGLVLSVSSETVIEQ